ncbi:MAG: HAD-IA family hydrolase [Nitrospirales bacterium]|nr:HAD-IA family hydrolase [Nitrospirales bacterium]
MSSSPIKVIFFDAVGTLFDVKGSVGEVYLTYAKKYGVPDTEHTQHALNAAFRQTIKDMPPPIFSVERPEKLKQCERLWWFDVVHAVFYRVGMFEGFDDFFEEVFEAFGNSTHWELFPETFEILAELKGKGFELGIISNFDSRFFQVSRGLGLNTFFDSVTISGLVGSAKPAKNIFAHALDEHMVIPQEALHVGDHPIEDFEGARKAGLHAVLIDRSTDDSLPHPQTLSNLTQLSSYDLLHP